MPDSKLSDDELKQYFSSRDNRDREATVKSGSRIGRFWMKRFPDARKSQAATAISYILSVVVAGTLIIGVLIVSLVGDLPPLTEIENPNFQLATIAYTADGVELARYASQNRSWVSYNEISPHVINALVATEDHRFYAHWGIDLFRTLAIPYHILQGRPQGGSTITQQLARNLYNKRIGKKVTVSRKLKEMITAVQLEQRYTKPEIIEMYLNTVEFSQNAFGIEAAAHTYFGKNPMELDELEGATLVGMLQAITYYNPVRNPENSRRRRNTVLGQMVKRGLLPTSFLDEHRADSVRTSYNSSDITKSLAPYFAEYVRNWLNGWARDNKVDLYKDGLVVYTTLDSRLQQMAEDAVHLKMPCLQAVADYEWSKADSLIPSTTPCDYLEYNIQPFEYFWSSRPNVLRQIIRETERYRLLRKRDVDRVEAVEQLMQNEQFLDSLKTIKTRLEAGFVAMDPQTGYIKAWVGGRDLATDWYDHVGIARRQPGSTFKPFVYTAAIDNGWSPYYMLPDDSVKYVDDLGNVWSPTNSSPLTGEMMTLREGLAYSKNTITAQLMLEVGPSEVAYYARRMGIESPLDEVPSLALGTSDVTLLEMTNAYSTFANGGLLYKPTFVTRIEDRFGNVLFEDTPAPKEALSEATAYTMIDMLRAVILEGTGQRIRSQYRLGNYDLAGKTGTTQNSTDNWFMMMHPDLVMGAWVGFNDARFSLKSNWWGQGAHTALFLVGDFFTAAIADDETFISKESRFPAPTEFGAVIDGDSARNERGERRSSKDRRKGRVSW